MKTISATILALFFTSSIFAQTTIPGGTITDLDWTKAESPYQITGDITLDWTDDLVIEPGVEVIFMDDYRLDVEGRLLAIGNTTDSIWFYPDDTIVGWQGIRFLNQNTNGQDSSKLVFCKIMYGIADGSGEDVKGGGIYCNNSSELLINKSEISHNLADIGGGIYCDASSHPLIVETIIEYNQANSGGGMYCDNSNLQLNYSYVRFNQATVNGGGIYCNGGSPVFTSDTISNNQADEGGGMYPYSSNITIYNSSINYNIALINGGGIFQLSSTCSIFDTDISFNTSLNESSGSGGYPGGGGIYIRYGSLNQTRVTIEGNSTNEAGGGIHCQHATIIADTVEFVNNSAVTVGGAIYSHDYDNITFSNSQFISNQSDKGGGIYTSQHSTIELEKVTFLGNSAIDYGGGASFAHSYCNLVNVEFRHDTANNGGGIALYQCYSFQLDRVLISDNVASDKGGGVLFRDSPGTSVDFINVTFSKNTAVNDGKAIYTTVNDNLTIKNCIVWDHLSPAISGSGVITPTYSDIEGGYAGTGNIDLDPQFTDPDNEDYTLAWDNYPFNWGTKSPCIDTGDPVSPTDPDGTIADMGAFYFHQTTTPISGNINDTLKCLESPYLVMGDLTVVSGDDLVIEPCVHLIFMDDYRLNVEGRLQAIGNTTDSILFYPMDTTSGWQGIRFLNQNTNGQDSSKLKYCNIRYGKADGGGEDSKGGGIYCNNSSELLISKSELSHNQAGNGGGIYCDSSSIQLEDCCIRYNTVSNRGGGYFAENCDTITFENSEFGNNSCGYQGGAGFIQNSVCLFNNVNIFENNSGNKGGGIHFEQGSLLNITNSEFFQNTSGHDGGAISNVTSNCNLTNVSIKECISNIGGGGIAGFDASYELSNCKIDDCQAVHGGGIFLFGASSMTANFSLITFNYSGANGGGVGIWSNAEVELNNVTISKNDAGGNGKAIYTSSPNPLYIKNSIIYHQSSPEIAGSGPINATYSFINYSGTGNIYGYPYLTDPDNGDFTLIWDNYPYLSGIKSPCIDKGDPASPKDPDSTRADIGAIPYLQYYTAIEGGDIYDTLFCAESPYFVFGDLTVPTGQELVIEPCVNVIFQGDYRLQVDGRLLAQGNDSTFIYFRSGDMDEGWLGIRFYDQNINGQDSSSLKYCEIKYGNADGIGEDRKGGGLYFNNSSDVAITGLYIYYCNATDKGGGIYIDSSNIKINKGYFYSNDANYGGGIYCENSIIELNDMDFRYNGKTANSLQGGGIYSKASNININNAEFYDNDTEWDGGALIIYDNSICAIYDALFQHCTTGSYGGGIAINNSIVEIFDSEIKFCGSYGNGGGISVMQYSELLINDCNLYNNNANNNGGGLCALHNANVNIINSKISNNWVYKDGGGIWIIQNSNLNMEYTLLNNNSASEEGGGIVAWYTTPVTLTNVTLSKNTAGTEGGAIHKDNSNFTMKNGIIWGNSDPQLIGSGGWSFQYSDVPYGGPGNIYADPMFKNPNYGDFNLMWANFPINDTTKSPCINTGDPNSPLNPDSTRADMGALYFDHYQYSPVITSIVDVPNDQGKQLVITWDKSPLDHIDTAKITHYKIWRMQNWAKTPWEYIGETPAHFFDEYAYIAPTISDSTAAGVPYYTYLVSAETANPYAFYNSRADSGYSVDNLAPEPPKGFYGYQEDDLIKLFWNPAGEDDFDYFALYKSFDPANFPTDPYITLSDTIFDDPDLSNDTLYYKLTAFDYNGNESGSSETVEIIIGKNLNLKVFLEGSFFVTQMIPFLNLGGYISLTQPYNQPPWNYNGDDAVVQIPNSDIVDWVLLEFRDATDPASASGSTVIYKIAAFLKGDGTIVGLDGINPPKVNLDYVHNLYLVVWHRNHVGIMSALPVAESADSYTYDFTDMADKTYGGEKAVKFLNTGMWGMNAADANADGQIDNKDKNDYWLIQLYNSGYYSGDFNMDTEVDLIDKDNFWIPNSGKSSFVPE